MFNMLEQQHLPDDLHTCHTIQRYVLAVFYFSTSGFQWTECSGPKLYCEEENIKASLACNRTVTRHNSNDRIGSLGTEAWLTPSHECEWGGLACHGENTPELAQCLDQIDLEANNLRGVIPDEVASLEHLRFLYLEKGEMSGTISSALGSLENLEVLGLSYNNFTGQVDPEICALRAPEGSLRNLEVDCLDEVTCDCCTLCS